MSFALLLLAVAEFALRLAGYGGYPPFIRSSGNLPSGEEVCLVEPAASKPYFFANPSRPGYAEQTNFLMPKPPDTFRIFIIGESAAKGYPQPRNLGMGAFLETMLEDRRTNINVEIINLGTTAVASFPLVYAVRDALAYAPDLFIIYTGNNEFFGTYGTESINADRLLPARWARAIRGLALSQALSSWLYKKPPENKTLMEEMMARAVVPVDSPSRAKAARNLGENLRTMIDAITASNIPVIVCTTASNESGLAPLGDPDGEARAMFDEAKKNAAAGNLREARDRYLDARDHDTLPWRPTRATEQAIRDAAAATGATLCDIAQIFRDESAEGATGWDLLDDHVHLSVQGHARAARAMADGIAGVPELGWTASELPDWQDYAHRLGTNFYDDYRVNHTLRVLFGVPFMRESNPEAFTRFDRACQMAERKMPPAILQEARRWQTITPHAGGLRPIAGMIARVLLAAGQTADALPLYELAQRQVPDYTSWYLEYLYFALACREKINGTLDAADLARAAHGIAQGTFLLAHGESTSGLTERYTARLHQLRNEWNEAIPFLLAARKKLSAEDLVACDQALVMSYIKTGRLPEAHALIEDGIQNSGSFAAVYRVMKNTLPEAATGPGQP